MSVRPPRDRPLAGEDSTAERLGPYVLVEELASGALCTVHLAHPQDGQDASQLVVLKRLSKAHARDPERRAALQQEARLGARLRSPNLARVLFSDDEPETFVVMEHVEGDNLARLLARADPRDPLTTRYLVPLFVDALQGLSVLHDATDASGARSFLVHQAPCARHILVGIDGRARLLDLTLAIGPGQPRSRLLDERLHPAEMAPEQALAPAHIDPRCDLFILGVALWEALTGKRLFSAASPQEALEKMLRAPIVAPSEAGAACGRSFDRVCARALRRLRGERYGTAAEMAEELREDAKRAGLFAEPHEISFWVCNLIGRPDAMPVWRTLPTVAAPTLFGLGLDAPSTPATDEPAADSAQGALATGDAEAPSAAAQTITEPPPSDEPAAESAAPTESEAPTDNDLETPAPSGARPEEATPEADRPIESAREAEPESAPEEIAETIASAEEPPRAWAGVEEVPDGDAEEIADGDERDGDIEEVPDGDAEEIADADERDDAPRAEASEDAGAPDAPRERTAKSDPPALPVAPLHASVRALRPLSISRQPNDPLPPLSTAADLAALRAKRRVARGRREPPLFWICVGAIAGAGLLAIASRGLSVLASSNTPTSATHELPPKPASASSSAGRTLQSAEPQGPGALAPAHAQSLPLEGSRGATPSASTTSLSQLSSTGVALPTAPGRPAPQQAARAPAPPAAVARKPVAKPITLLPAKPIEDAGASAKPAAATAATGAPAQTAPAAPLAPLLAAPPDEVELPGNPY